MMVSKLKVSLLVLSRQVVEVKVVYGLYHSNYAPRQATVWSAKLESLLVLRNKLHLLRFGLLAVTGLVRPPWARLGGSFGRVRDCEDEW